MWPCKIPKMTHLSMEFCGPLPHDVKVLMISPAADPRSGRPLRFPQAGVLHLLVDCPFQPFLPHQTNVSLCEDCWNEILDEIGPFLLHQYSKSVKQHDVLNRRYFGLPHTPH